MILTKQDIILSLMLIGMELTITVFIPAMVGV